MQGLTNIYETNGILTNPHDHIGDDLHSICIGGG